jgi:ribosome recycling factor
MVDDIIAEAKSKMKSTLSVFESDLQGLRGNRASPSLVDRLHVDYYGQPTELRQLASISTPEPTQILIRPFDKTAVKSIEKAIQQSDIGINPNVDGENIRLNMPPLTRERRQQLTKVVHTRMEETRVAIRNVRRAANDDLKDFEKEGMISEDDLERGESEIQKLTDKFVEEIENLGKAKEKDIMEI